MDDAADMRQAVAAIEAMVQKLRTRFGPAVTGGPGWWVVLCGRSLDPDDFGQREQARQELAGQARRLGLAGNECTWVWDETDTAQVVVFQAADEEQANFECQRLRAMGLRVRVVREFA